MASVYHADHSGLVIEPEVIALTVFGAITAAAAGIAAGEVLGRRDRGSNAPHPQPGTGRAGLPPITLHDSRHITLTLMEHAGVPISIVSKWAGHYDSAFTQKTYVHASNDDLRRGGGALARIHKIT